MLELLLRDYDDLLRYLSHLNALLCIFYLVLLAANDAHLLGVESEDLELHDLMLEPLVATLCPRSMLLDIEVGSLAKLETVIALIVLVDELPQHLRRIYVLLTTQLVAVDVVNHNLVPRGVLLLLINEWNETWLLRLLHHVHQ